MIEPSLLRRALRRQRVLKKRAVNMQLLHGLMSYLQRTWRKWYCPLRASTLDRRVCGRRWVHLQAHSAEPVSRRVQLQQSVTLKTIFTMMDLVTVQEGAEFAKELGMRMQLQTRT